MTLGRRSNVLGEEPHALLSRLLTGKDFLPRAFLPCQGRRLGRPRRGNARIDSGAIVTLSYGNPRALEYGRSTHDLQIADHHFFDTGELLQLAFYLALRRSDFDQKRGSIRNVQLFRLRGPLDRLRDFSPRPHWQKPKAFRFELQKDQLFFWSRRRSALQPAFLRWFATVFRDDRFRTHY
jgi:hypothetical protein